ncbi:MAG: flippase activity-associated protein Agl23, partial [Dehalococcoidia bacterium]
MSTYAGESELASGSRLGEALRRGLDRVLALELHLTAEFWLYTALIVVVLVMRFADLGTRALHHDESLHATYSWYLATGRGYIHDPLMHGPFLFHITALVYLLFGASDASARYAPALLGSAVVLMPLLLRPWLGRVGAFAAALFIAFSPSLLYYDRFIRNEPWVALWTIGLIVCVFRYRPAKQQRYLYGAATFLMLEFVSKETAFMFSAIFVIYLAFAAVWALARQKELDLKNLPADAEMFLLLALLSAPQFSAAIRVPLKSVLHYNINAIPGYTIFGHQLSRMAFVGGVTVVAMLLITTVIGIWWDQRRWLIAAAIFYIPYFLLYTTFLHNRLGFGSGIWGSLSYWLDQQGVQRGAQPVFYFSMTLSTYEYLTMGLGAAGLVWQAARRGWRNAALLLVAALLIPATVLINGRFGNLPSAPFALGAVVLATAAMTGDSLRQFLVFYFGALLFGLSVAGEKMPWLTVHLALPLTLLAALFVNDVFGRLLARVEWRSAWAVIAVTGAVAAGAAAVLSASGASSALVASALLVLLIDVVAGGAAAAYVMARRSAPDRRLIRYGMPAAAAGVAAFVGFFGVLTVKNDFRMNFIHPDTPDEMLIYTQSSPDIPKLMQKIGQLAKESGQGHNLKITVDSNDAFTWPWAWYLRDYKNTSYPDLTVYQTNPSGASALDPGSVLLLNAADQNVAAAFPGIYGPGERFHHRWWFPEGYKATTAKSFWTRLRDGAELKRWWGYVTHRSGFATPPSDVSPGKATNGIVPSIAGQPPAGKEFLGAVDAVAYFPAGWVPGMGINATQTTTGATPARVSGSTLTIGSLGVAPGQFRRPTGLATDADGNIYVADSQNNRVQKFDRNGGFVAQAGGPGSSITFTEPWDVAVGADGSVYVADTWAYRIVKLDRNLKFVKAWGQGTGAAGPTSPLDLYGPRSIAIDAAGNLWVTDTGDGRVVEFDANGAPLGAFGQKGSGPGQFNEPVGIAIGSD